MKTTNHNSPKPPIATRDLVEVLVLALVAIQEGDYAEAHECLVLGAAMTDLERHTITKE